MLGLGLNAWLACVGWPLWLLREGSLGAGAACAALLCAGAYALHRDRSRSARWLLVCAFPASLAAQVALVPEARLERAHTQLSVTLAALAVIAYVLGALLACQPKPTSAALRTLPLPTKGRERGRHSVLRTFVVSLLVFGALAIAVVAPLSSPWSEVEAAWRDAAAPGAALAAVIAAALATTLLGAELGSLLRRADMPRMKSAAERRLRVATLLFVSVLGAVVYYTIIDF